MMKTSSVLLIILFSFQVMAKDLIVVKELKNHSHQRSSLLSVSTNGKDYTLHYQEDGKKSVTKKISELDYKRFHDKFFAIILKQEDKDMNCKDPSLTMELVLLKESAKICRNNTKSYFETKGIVSQMINDFKIL